MPSTVEARAKQGKFLIYIAWFIEISAAVVGLAFAWFTLLQRKGQIEARPHSNPQNNLPGATKKIILK